MLDRTIPVPGRLSAEIYSPATINSGLQGRFRRFQNLAGAATVSHSKSEQESGVPNYAEVGTRSMVDLLR